MPSTAAETPLAHIAIGVIVNGGEVLVSRRRPDAHLGGLWEFPGGKIENGESAMAALRRELREELSIEVLEARFWMRLDHRYEDRDVTLEIFEVLRFCGEAQGAEGQSLRWLRPEALLETEFPSANRPIIEALLEREREGFGA